MALERESIEKKDFPVGRRGYDTAAVDAHLHALADQVEELTSSPQRRTESLASAASEQVRAIVEAAEKSAEEIRQQADDEARQMRAEARRDARKERADAKAEAQHEREQAAAAAQTEREQATTQGREYVERVSDATSQMLKRHEAMDAELGDLTDSVRTGGTRLKAELDLLESELREASVTARPPAAPEPVAELEEPEELEEHEEEQLEAPEEELELEEPEELPAAEEPEEEPALEPVAEPAPAAAGEEDDTEGARLIALNMALNGTPREETDRYLAENFELSDRGRLLDDVYASVED